jgi:hypothetical protein
MTMPQTLQGHAPGTALRRLGRHSKMIGSLADDLAAERAAFNEAIIDALSELADDGTPRWSHEQLLDALEPLVGGQRRPPEPRWPPEDMKGRGTFTTAQAQRICELLETLEQARDAGDRLLAKTVRRWLREIGFYLSDWKQSSEGFQRIDFDRLVYHGAIEITDR